MKVELRPRRERRVKINPLNDQPILNADGEPITEELLPGERSIWVGEEGEDARHVGYVAIAKRCPINILPPTTIGVARLEWPREWVREICDAVCQQLDARTGSRPCS